MKAKLWPSGLGADVERWSAMPCPRRKQILRALVLQQPPESFCWQALPVRVHHIYLIFIYGWKQKYDSDLHFSQKVIFSAISFQRASFGTEGREASSGKCFPTDFPPVPHPVQPALNVNPTNFQLRLSPLKPLTTLSASGILIWPLLQGLYLSIFPP